MLRNRSIHLLQAGVILLWLVVFWFGFKFFLASGIPIRHLPRALKTILHAYGAWGPLCILGLYLLRSIFFFIPTAVLTLVSGSLYGPFFGTILNVIGENVAAHLAFGCGRLLGRRFVRAHEHGWVKKYDELLRQEGFLTILFMRALYFPFDLVNYGSGMTGMLYRQYAFGTFLGLLPSIITLTVLGGSFTHPAALATSLFLFVVSLVSAFLLRRSTWFKRRLYPHHVHETI